MNMLWIKKPHNRSIALSILLAMLTIALVPLLIMAIQGYHCASMAVVQLQTSHLNSVLHARMARITDWLQERKNDITAIAEASCTKFICSTAKSETNDTERQKICALLDHTHLRESAYESLVVYSANWKRLESSGKSVHSDEELTGTDFRKRLMQTFTAIITAPHIHKDGAIVIHIGAPVFNDKNVRTGYVIAALNLSVRLYPILEDRAGFGRTTRTYMLYNGNHYLSLSGKSGRMHNKQTTPPPAILNGTHGHAEFYKNCSGENVIGVSARINDLDWMLVAEINKSEAFAWLTSLRSRALITGIIALLLVILLAIRYSRKITSPLLALAAVADEISAGNFNKRLPILSGREPRKVAIAFNTMLDELSKVHAELVQVAALSAIGKLTSSIVHEMRNPLSSVKMNLKALQNKVADDDVYSELAEIARKQTVRLENMLNDLLQYGKPLTLNKKAFLLKELFDSVFHAVSGLDNNCGVKLITEDNSGGVSIKGDVEQLCRAITNLADNAICASPAGAVVTINGRVEKKNNKRVLIIDVIDNGTGISDNVMKHLFEPFFTTRSKGTGLGLANVHKIIELHGGTVKAYNRKEKGAIFTIIIPIEK